jgi:hypothetical protein
MVVEPNFFTNRLDVECSGSGSHGLAVSAHPTVSWTCRADTTFFRNGDVGRPFFGCLTMADAKAAKPAAVQKDPSPAKPATAAKVDVDATAFWSKHVQVLVERRTERNARVLRLTPCFDRLANVKSVPSFSKTRCRVPLALFGLLCVCSHSFDCRSEFFMKDENGAWPEEVVREVVRNLIGTHLH